MACTINLVVASFYVIEVLVVSLKTFYLTSAAGKIIAQIVSFGFLIFWVFAYRAAYQFYYDGLDEHKRRHIDEKNNKSLKKPKPVIQ